MSISVEWDNAEQTTILFTYQRPWNWNEFDAAVEQSLAYLDMVQHPVDVIFDLRSGGFPPKDAVWRFKTAAEITHPNIGKYVYVAPSILVIFVKNVIEILNRAYGGFGNFQVPPITFVKTPEEGRAFLDEARQKKMKQPVRVM
jgi:hypothetical protein